MPNGATGVTVSLGTLLTTESESDDDSVAGLAVTTVAMVICAERNGNLYGE